MDGIVKNLDASIWSESYDLILPIQVPLENGKPLVCEDVVRAMPNRRYVCRGIYDGKPIFVKLFSMSRKARREWQREQQGIRDLREAGIPCPEIIYIETSTTLASQIIVYNELPGAESAKYRWEHGNETARQMLFMQLTELMSRHHMSGIRQTDCHLLNFIFSEDILYTLDAADITKSSSPLSRQNSMDGLADMLGLFENKYDLLLPSLYKYYWQCREEKTDDNELERLTEKVTGLRQYKLRKYLEKIYRSCSEFIAKRTWNKFSVYRRDADSESLREIINDPDKNIDRRQNIMIKDGNTCTVKLLETPEQMLVCKRYNIKSAWHGLMRAFRASRASRSWRNAHRLKRLLIATPQPQVLIEQRFGPIRRKAWLLMSYIDGISAHDFFRDESKANQHDIVASQFAMVFSKMVEAKLSHGDMKATNFIFSHNVLFVIDLDSMQQHQNDADFAAAFRIDMQRFMRNWDELPEVAAMFVEQLSTTVAAEFLPTSIKS